MSYTNTNPETSQPIPAIGSGGDIVSIGASILNGLLGYGQSIIDRKTQRESDDRSLAANKELAAYSYSQDLDMWNRQNAYNTPEKQMERFKAAGLNPNLIYGQGNPGNAQQMPKYNTPRADYSDKSLQIGGMLNNYQDMRAKQSQIDNMRELTNLTREKAATETLNQGIKANQIGITGAQAQVAEKLQAYNMQTKAANLDKIKAATASELARGNDIKAATLQKLSNNELQKLEKQLKQKELEYYKKYNVRPNDAIWFRWMAEGLKGLQKAVDTGGWQHGLRYLRPR